MFGAIVRDSLLARVNCMVIVYDAEAAGRQFRIERIERLNRGFVEVAIQPQDSNAVYRSNVQGVFEPARQKADSVIEHPIALKVSFDFLYRYPMEAKEVQPNALICFVIRSVRAWQALERIG